MGFKEWNIFIVLPRLALSTLVLLMSEEIEGVLYIINISHYTVPLIRPTV